MEKRQKSCNHHQSALLVAGDAMLRQVLKRNLQMLDYGVIEAGDGAWALMLDRAKYSPLHLLICDVRLDDMDGLELARLLRERRAGLRVVFVSSYGPAIPPVSQVLAAGEAYLDASFDMAALAALLDAA